ncbi:FxsA family protein [Maliponia aquimaris]|uniref:Phage T7 F exclusion suppressor FxsA n=1 Tax=Maliponia aquimaris TaxID=1673631 RepID=A0A238JNP6_9RHOB|nr:FxsA family protein [Maliponia aquimaris]SMX32308.1 phage T7 F exclusion suppressor FxsA [Maliponia aquimaris]
MWVFLAFLAVPLIEIALFIQVGGLIGLWPTLGVVVLTAVIGTWLVRTQGRLAMENLRRSFSALNDPSEPLAHGAMILVAGVLLLTPGFFTDGVGFALLAPPVRSAVFHWVRKRIKVARFEMGPTPNQPFSRDPRPTDGPGDVIEGEFNEIPQGKAPNHPGSGWTRH